MNYKKPSPLDPPKSSFRIRLVTVLLKGCGDYFVDDKVNRLKLKYYIKFLQVLLLFIAVTPSGQIYFTRALFSSSGICTSKLKIQSGRWVIRLTRSSLSKWLKI